MQSTGHYSQTHVSNATPFQDRFRRFSAVRRGLLNATLGYRLGGMALTALCAGLVLLGGYLPNLYVNAALFLLLAVFLLTLAVLFLVRRRRFRSCMDEAHVMEELAGRQLNSRLISALDFQAQQVQTPLTEAVIDRASNDFAFPFEEKLDRQPRNRRRRQFFAWFAAALILGCLPWTSFGRFLENARRTWLAIGDTLFPAQYALEPAPGRHIQKLGATVPVTFTLAKRVYDSVTFVVVSGDETTRTPVTLGTDGRARLPVSSSAEAEFTVSVAFGRRQTPEVNLVFTAVPVLVNMQSELVYPVYTRLLPRTLEGVQSRLMGLAGTRITMGFTFSKPVESAAFAWDDGESLPLDVVGRFASTTILHNRQRRATLQVQDKFGFGLEFPLVIDFEVQQDEKPRLYMPKHLKDDMPLLAKELPLFGFGFRAEDDFGVTRCLLKWQKSTVDNPGQILERGEIERLVSPAQRKTILNFEKVFAGLPLQPGDKLTFSVDVFDNCMPDKQVTRSRPASIFIYREELAGLTIKELGFSKDAALLQGRIAKSQRATSVKEPEGGPLREKVRNEFEAAVSTSTQAPTVRGEFGGAARDYFKLLSGVALKDETEKTVPAKTTTPR